MTTYYVGIGGNDGNNGTTWALRKLTLNGAEDIPVAAGDTVYVGAGAYRELLTCDVSGSAGNTITYIGDYDGSHTDGIGGVVRITGSDDDLTATRDYCIYMSDKVYRAFRGFKFDLCASHLLSVSWAGEYVNIDKCFFGDTLVGNQLFIQNPTGNCSVTNCYFSACAGGNGGVRVYNATVLDDRNISINNCIFRSKYGITIAKVGGVLIKNCSFVGCPTYAVVVSAALTEGQTVTVNNSIIMGCNNGLVATVEGELVENYNTFFSNATNRTNVAVGANSITYPPVFDSRWFFEATKSGFMKLLMPFDLASYSPLVNVAGTSPTSTDMRGTAVVGAQREWGALEYDPSLRIKGGEGSLVGGGLVRD